MARTPLDTESPTVALTLKLPRATVEAVDAVAGKGGRSDWIRNVIDKALSGRRDPAPQRSVPIGGQDAAAGAGVEARRDVPDLMAALETSLAAAKAVTHRDRPYPPNCGKGNHPPGSRLGTVCGHCGDEKAWPA